MVITDYRWYNGHHWLSVIQWWSSLIIGDIMMVITDYRSWSDDHHWLWDTIFTTDEQRYAVVHITDYHNETDFHHPFSVTQRCSSPIISEALMIIPHYQWYNDVQHWLSQWYNDVLQTDTDPFKTICKCQAKSNIHIHIYRWGHFILANSRNTAELF